MNTNNSQKAKKPTARLAAATGLLNGLLGSGGGTIAVFGMQRWLGVETHKSHATAVAVILPMSIVSLIVYGRHGIPDLRLVLYVSLGGLIGGFIGAKLLKKISSSMLHKIFGMFMVVAAVKMIF